MPGVTYPLGIYHGGKVMAAHDPLRQVSANRNHERPAVRHLLFSNDVGALRLADIRDVTMIHQIKSTIDRIGKADPSAPVRLHGDLILPEHRAVILARIDMLAHTGQRVTGQEVAEPRHK